MSYKKAFLKKKISLEVFLFQS